MQNPNIDFPTGKPHISYSEFSNWHACSWRHKLQYVDKIDKFEQSIYTESGTAVHAACENYVKTRNMDYDICFDILKESWEKYGFTKLEDWLDTTKKMLFEVPKFLDDTFHDWECFDAEEMLYEEIDNHDQKFKGYIDAIIKVKGKKDKDIYWLLDWKTASWGWRRDKKQDFKVQMQLVLYKNYWSKKHNIPLKDIRCGFVLLKRSGKDGSRCELVTVSAGPKTISKAEKNINNMLISIKRKMFLKNRNNCRFCPYKDSQHCL